MSEVSPEERPSAQHRRDRGRPREATDKAVGSGASVLGLLVVLASVPSPSKTGVICLTGVLLGMFGYLLGAHRLGVTTILASTAVIVVWVLT